MFKTICLIWITANCLAFILMGIDKYKARHDQWRISETALFLAAFFGGIGATLGMFFFHHKTKHWVFRIGFPILAVLQIIVMIFLWQTI